MGEACQIRCPVFGFIPLSAKEADIVNTSVFQRLRYIRQLAFASLVYPGALHTRFEHSLGVCHIAGMLAEKQLEGNRDKADLVRLVRFAALLHDLGHGPFSHVTESALCRYADRSKLGDSLKKREKIHERVTVDIIRNNRCLIRLLGESDCATVTKLLSEGYGEPFLRSIISGPLDADKQDYLLRDSHFCGVKYGVFDIRQLHRELCAIEDPSDRSRQLGITPDGIFALEQFVLAKYHLTNQVYRHRVRLITDQMLLRAIELGVEYDQLEELRSLFAYDGSPEFADRYVNWDDNRFLFTYLDKKYKGTFCQDILKRLYERRLLKRVYERRLAELPERCKDYLADIAEMNNLEKRQNIEERLHDLLSELCGERLEAHILACKLLILNTYTVKSIRMESQKDEGPILVARQPPTTFWDESALFRSITASLSESFVEVYAPVVYDSLEEKRRLLAMLEKPITELLAALSTEERDDEAS